MVNWTGRGKRAKLYKVWLILGSGVLEESSGHQGSDQRAEEDFAPFSWVMDELKASARCHDALV